MSCMFGNTLEFNELFVEINWISVEQGSVLLSSGALLQKQLLKASTMAHYLY